MRRLLFAILAVFTIATLTAVTDASAAPRAHAGIFCPIYPQPIQTVMHIVCTA